MGHLVKPILLILGSAAVVAVILGIFGFIEIVNYTAHCANYVYVLAYFVFNFPKIRKMNVTLF